MNRQATDKYSSSVETKESISRIEELETKITFQDHLIEQLNQALIQQQNDLNKITRIMESVVSQVERLGDTGPNSTQVELPPHY